MKCVVSRNGREADIQFPCGEKDIRRVQTRLEIPYETDTRVKVIAVDSDISELSVLEGQNEDLDFLNLLGRLMYGMDEHEYKQFRIGLYHERPSNLKEIINISQVVNRYSIITDDLYDSGLDHEMDVRGGIPTSEVDITDYSIAAQKLLDSGKCLDTPYGTLYVNDEIPIEEFFDGQHMPAYFDRQFQIACFLKNDTDRDFLMLPCTDAEIQRAGKRLNSAFPYDLDVQIEDIFHTNSIVSRLAKQADICTLNEYARLMNGLDEDETDKFETVLYFINREYKAAGGIRTLSDAIKLGGVLGAFTFYPNAMCDDDLGMTLLEEHDIPEELWGYFDSERYGEVFRNEESGQFTENGYIGINDSMAIRKCLYQDQGMGGIQ